MRSVKLLTDSLGPERAAADRWYVSNGVTAVGPVSTDLLARGIEAGKVPLESFVRHEAWKVWRPLTEIAVVTGENGETMSLADADDAVISRVGAITLEEQAHFEALSSPGLSVPPVAEPIPSFSVEAASSDARPTPRLPPLRAASVFSEAKNLSEALLLLLSTASARVSAGAALIHHVLDDGAAAVVSAHGPRMLDLLGRRTPLSDPAVMAAASGLTIVTEPSPGPAGQAILKRLGELGAPIAFALMLPIRPGGRLFGMLEMGRPTPFSPDEVAEAGSLTTELAHLIDAARWA